MKRRPPSSTLFPYPALSRSEPASGMPPSGGPASGGPASGGPASGGPASGIGASTSNPSTRVLVLPRGSVTATSRSEEHTSELQSQSNLVCRLLLEKKKYDGEQQPRGPAEDRGPGPDTVDFRPGATKHLGCLQGGRSAPPPGERRVHRRSPAGGRGQ